MRIIKYKELGSYFKEKAEKEFNCWYSSNTNNYLADIREEYNEKEDIYNCHVELCKTGHPPLIIEFYKRYIFDENNNIIDEEFLIN